MCERPSEVRWNIQYNGTTRLVLNAVILIYHARGPRRRLINLYVQTNFSLFTLNSHAVFSCHTDFHIWQQFAGGLLQIKQAAVSSAKQFEKVFAIKSVMEFTGSTFLTGAILRSRSRVPHRLIHVVHRLQTAFCRFHSYWRRRTGSWVSVLLLDDTTCRSLWSSVLQHRSVIIR